VLAGIIAGFVARGAEPLRGAAWGVYVHALAGERLSRRVGTLGFLARELLPEIPRLLDALGGEDGGNDEREEDGRAGRATKGRKRGKS
jgi:ADP-dependent NAD(P)H-hydrate dehydratase